MTAVAKLDAMKRIADFVAVREKMAGTDPEVITESNGVPLLMSDLRAALSPAELGGVEATVCVDAKPGFRHVIDVPPNVSLPVGTKLFTRKESS